MAVLLQDLVREGEGDKVERERRGERESRTSQREEAEKGVRVDLDTILPDFPDHLFYPRPDGNLIKIRIDFFFCSVPRAEGQTKSTPKGLVPE